MTDDPQHTTDELGTTDQTDDAQTENENADARLDTVEQRVEDHQAILDGLKDHLGGDGDGIGPVTTRRGVLTAGGVLGLVGLGAGAASADASGQVGTSSDPLQDLYTEALHGHSGTLTLKDSLSLDGNKLTNAQSINGSVTGNTEITDLVGSGLTISSGSLQTSTPSKLATSSNSVTAVEVIDGNSSVSASSEKVTPPNVIGGHPNNNTGGDSVKGVTVFGGKNKFAPSSRANTASADFATVGGGKGNTASAPGDFDIGPTVGGGIDNTADEQKATVAGGKSNTASGSAGTVGGGSFNEASDNNATVAGGSENTASGKYATAAGGRLNTASAENATVAGGRNNIANGDDSFAAGRDAKTNGKNGAFVWGDSSTTSVTAGAANEVRFQATGGFVIAPESDQTNMLDVQDSGGNSVLKVDTLNDKVDMKGNLDLKGNNIECTSTLGTDFKALVDADGSGEDSQISFIFPDKDTAEEIKWARDASTDDAFRVTDTNNSNTLFTVNDGGNVDIFDGNLDMNNGNVVNTSDRRLKTAIEPIQDAIAKLGELEAATYTWEDDDAPEDREAGVIAQSVQRVLPEAVSEDEDGYLKLAYRQLTPLLIEATQEQQDHIENLEAENEQLRERSAELEDRLAAVEAELGIDATASQQGVADD